MLLPNLSYPSTTPSKPILHSSRFNFHNHNTNLQRKPQSIPQTIRSCNKSIFTKPNRFLTSITRSHDSPTPFTTSQQPDKNGGITDQPADDQGTRQGSEEKSFWGAVGLIIGTAVGPGMLALPSATIRSGPIPSTIAILVSWIYVISSIVLVAELSFAAMEEDNVNEVSFTGLATKSLGSRFGAFVAVVYACLSFALLVASVSGIGSIVSQWFPTMNFVIANSLFPLASGIIIIFFPFNVIDATNRSLCFLMLFSITALVIIGLSVARTNVLASFAYASWSVSSILPAIPVTVLTLGFHVITPFICKIAGKSVSDARKAVLVGGSVPLIMVLSWNLIVLGLAGGTSSSKAASSPISLLLSLNPSALPAVQGFAFAALATSFIGYAVSFPKQLVDTLKLIFGKSKTYDDLKCPNLDIVYDGNGNGNGKCGFVTYSTRNEHGNTGKILFNDSKGVGVSDVKLISSRDPYDRVEMFLMPIVLGVPALIASFFPSTFSKALDFAGVYANCFLFGILPPAMAYVQQSRKKLRLSVLPGGDGSLFLLFGVAIVLGIWH